MNRFAAGPRLLGSIVLLFALSATAADIAPTAQPPGPGSKQKLIMQVSDADPANWKLALNNAKNVQAVLGAANVEIEIVAYGPGLGVLTVKSPEKDRVRESIAAGVRLVACENTMKVQKLTRDDMLPSLEYVEAGVVEVMVRQQQGYIYIRP